MNFGSLRLTHKLTNHAFPWLAVTGTTLEIDYLPGFSGVVCVSVEAISIITRARVSDIERAGGWCPQVCTEKADRKNQAVSLSSIAYATLRTWMSCGYFCANFLLGVVI